MALSGAPQLVLIYCCCWFTVCSSGLSQESAGRARGDQPHRPQQQKNLLEPPLLENELENQENVLSQLLGDYDKVKAISEGADCQCKCVVRPLGRNACSRIDEGTAKLEDFYTVESINSGPDCKCSCVAPPSAVNPCEGEYRLQRLREAERSGFKLSSVMELLEGALYGLDLLKLHSVTTKLVNRIEKLEKQREVHIATTDIVEGVVAENVTEEEETLQRSTVEPQKDEPSKAKSPSSEAENVPDLGAVLQGDAAAVYIHKEGKYEERFLGDKLFSVQTKASVRSRPHVHRPLHQKPLLILPQKKPLPKSAIIREITYYKARDEDESDAEEHQDEFASGENAIDLLVEDQLIRHQELEVHSTKRPMPVTGPPTTVSSKMSAQHRAYTTQATTVSLEHTTSSPVTSAASPETSATSPVTSTSSPVMTKTATTPVSTTHSMTTARTSTIRTSTARTSTARTSTARTSTARTSTQLTPATAPATTSSTSTVVAEIPTTFSHTYKTTTAATSTTASLTTTTGATMTSPGQSIAEYTEFDISKSIGVCKDTLSTISGPIVHNTYGRNEGAWMKDPLAKDDKIYITNYYYGSLLVEFRNLESFQQGRWSNSYKLPYSWIGTGHVVYNGAFYYNRAFTRNIIKFDLKLRFVAAWAMLHDAVYEEATPWRWMGHSDIDFAVDENGLWVIYPAIDEEGSHQEVIILSKLNVADLSMQKETTWRTGLRKNLYVNCFVICGVLYAVDSYNQRNANISYAFDTHTNTQLVPRLQFINEYSYTTQIDYNPRDRSLYTWDNGHQVTYHVIFAY